MTPEALEAYVDAVAASLDLPIDPQHKPGVKRYVAIAAQMAEQVNGLALDTHDEAAPQFVPISPRRHGGA